MTQNSKKQQGRGGSASLPAGIYGRRYAEWVILSKKRNWKPCGRNTRRGAGYVDLTAQDAEKVLAGEMKPKGHPGNPEYAVEMEIQELLGFRCKEADVRDRRGRVSALVY